MAICEFRFFRVLFVYKGNLVDFYFIWMRILMMTKEMSMTSILIQVF